MVLSTVGQQQIQQSIGQQSIGQQSIGPRQGLSQGRLPLPGQQQQPGGGGASTSDLLANLERLIAGVTHRGGRPPIVQDAFRDRVEQFRATRRTALTSARDQVEESVGRVNSLINDRLPTLRDLIDVGPEAAEAFDAERNSIIGFAGGLPVVETELIAGEPGPAHNRFDAIEAARKEVLGLQNPTRLPGATEENSPFNGFRSPQDVGLAQRRVSQEIEQNLPPIIQQFRAALTEISKQLQGEPSSLPIPVKMTFPYETRQAFFDRFSDEISLVTSSGEPTYRGNLQILGEFLFFGSPRGGNGNRLL